MSSYLLDTGPGCSSMNGYREAQSLGCGTLFLIRSLQCVNLISRLSGFTYPDVLHIYGISRAGYIPQLFSLRLPNPIVIYELLRKANAQAIIYDPSFESILNDCPVPSYRAFQSERIELVQESLPSVWDIHEDDIAFYFHTSGSTSGSPKLVPMSYRWLDSVVVKSRHISMPQNPDRQDVTVCM